MGRRVPAMPLIVYMLIGLWLWLFLLPMAKLGLLTNPDSFLLVFFSLSASMWVQNRLFRIAIAFMATTFYMDYYFRQASENLLWGFFDIFRSDLHGLPMLIHGNIPPDPLQTHLFLILLAILYWLVVYAASRPRIWILYSVLGLSIFMLIDGNTNVHPSGAMVGVLLISVVQLGILQFKSIMPRSTGRHLVQRFFLPFSVLILGISLVAALLPKYPAVWANPFKGIQNGIGRGGGTSVRMIGYQLDDSHLGGAFIMDNSPVMSVVENHPTYLRGEALATYTGKGWVSPNLDMVPTAYDTETINGFFTPLDHFAFRNMKTEQVKQKITVLSERLSTADLFTGWAPTKIASIPEISKNGSLPLDLVQGNLKAPQIKPGQTYTVESEELVNPYVLLAKTKAPYAQISANYQENPYMSYYFQLPKNLPSRVHALAVKIVGNAVSEFDMVNRIEGYLKQNYSYVTDDVPVPQGNQDYVDQFLFESKQGYCNNFSSSMAVMLRTLGIPTRWVTGFTSGEPESGHSGFNQYDILESDAHSWVEVFFPSYGWIPFDPTPNFDMNFGSDSSTASSQQNSVSSGTGKSKIRLPHTKDLQGSSTSSLAQTKSKFFGSSLFYVLALVFMVLASGAWLIRSRISRLRMQGFWYGAELKIPVKPIQYLIHLLKRRGMISNNEATIRDLRDAALKCDIHELEYKHFVKIVEEDWYGGQQPSSHDRRKLKDFWHRFVNSAGKKQKK